MDGDTVAGGGIRELTGAQIANCTVAQRQHALIADAHAAPVRHEHSGFFGDLEDRSAAVGVDDRSGRGEGDGATFTSHVQMGAETFDVQALPKVGSGPVSLAGVEHPGRAAGPHLALTPVRDDPVEVGGEVEHAVGVGVQLHQAHEASGGQLAQLGREDDLACGGRRVDHDDIGQLSDVVAQHAHDGGDPAAAGQEQDLGRAGRREDEVAFGLAEVDQGARAQVPNDVIADQAVGDGLGCDGHQTVGTVDPAGQRVGPPVPDAADVNAEAEVLPGDVPCPVGAGLDENGCSVGSFEMDLLDAARQRIGAGAQGLEDVERVGRHDGTGEHLGGTPGAVPKTASTRRGDSSGHRTHCSGFLR